MDIIKKTSPNFTKGTNLPKAVVIHIMAGTLVGTDDWFSRPSSKVSAHYGIGKKGEIHQYVKEKDSAWHAGIVNNPSWKLYDKVKNPNTYTIGIEHEGNENSVWSIEMKVSSARLIKDICTRWKIPIDRDHIIGHYEIDAVRRPNCPATKKNIIGQLIALAKII